MVSWDVSDRSRAVLAGVAIGAGAPVAVVGAINVSPESFYRGSVRAPGDLLDVARAMVEAGAALIDVGARSTAPYLPGRVGPDEERRRLTAAVEVLAGKLPVPVSADTARAVVARAALEAGARVINDVSGLRDPDMAPLAAERAAGLILMASPGPAAAAPGPEAPLDTVKRLLRGALDRARAAGVPDERIVLDPGIGFFRDVPMGWVAWDLAVLAGLHALADLGRPLCVGVSRKSFIGALTGRADPAERLPGSLAAAAAAVLNGAAAVRTHDVPETVDAVRVAERLRSPAP